MKVLAVFFLFLFILSYANFIRLGHLKPLSGDYTQAIEANTIHGSGDKEFIPSEFDTNCHFTKITPYIPKMGSHYICVSRMFAPFNPKKPTGKVVGQNGETLGYFYSTFSPDLAYHWHLHRNFCLKEGLAPTTELSIPQCILHGYYWWPFNKWMMHVWIIPSREGVNGLWL